MLKFDEATLCECCECNPFFSTQTQEEACTNVLQNCVLKYCRFDRILLNKPSVDCIRKSKNGYLILLEIKNQPSDNIDIDNIKSKIESTTRYLLENESELASLKKYFILSIPEQKQCKKVNKKQSISFFKIGEFLAHKRVSIFNNRLYKYDIDNRLYSVFSKVVLCSETDAFCK